MTRNLHFQFLKLFIALAPLTNCEQEPPMEPAQLERPPEAQAFTKSDPLPATPSDIKVAATLSKQDILSKFIPALASKTETVDVIACWFPECPSCVAELKVLAVLKSKFSCLRVIPLNRGKKPSDQFLSKNQSIAEIVTSHLAVNDAKGVHEALGIESYPYGYVLDEKGNVAVEGDTRAVVYGDFEGKRPNVLDLETRLKKVCKENW